MYEYRLQAGVDLQIVNGIRGSSRQRGTKGGTEGGTGEHQSVGGLGVPLPLAAAASIEPSLSLVRLRCLGINRKECEEEH